MRPSTLILALVGLVAFTASLPGYGVQFSSVLPTNRSVQVGAPASFFGTMINTSSSPAQNCAIFLATPIDAWFTYQATAPATNEPIGIVNTPVSIPANSSQSFVLTLTPNSVIAPTEISFTYSCEGEPDVDDISGINTLMFSASSNPVPDVVALASTVSADGIVELVQGVAGFFTLSSTNLGTGATLRVAPRFTGAAPLSASICKTNPDTSVCIIEPQPTVDVTIGNGNTPTFALFLTAPNPINLDAAKNRVFVEFRDDTGEVRGSTSVAVVASQNPDASTPPVQAPPETRTVRVTWQAPEQANTQISTYGIHFGAQSRTYSESVYVNPQDSGKDITVSPGQLYLSMTSQSSSGQRSDYSPELAVVID